MSDSFLAIAEEDFKHILNAEMAVEGIKVSQTTAVDSPFEIISGIFDETFLEVDLQTNAQAMSKEPRLTYFKNDIPFEVQQFGKTGGTIFTIKGQAYKVRQAEPDGQGSETVRLQKYKPDA
jgi:hypothetical protein